MVDPILRATISAETSLFMTGDRLPFPPIESSAHQQFSCAEVLINRNHEKSSKPFLNRTQAADYLGYHRKTLESWQKKGIGPEVLLLPSGLPVYRVTSLERFRSGESLTVAQDSP